MEGRLHLYEGHHPERIAFPVRLMRLLGTEVFVATNAAGGINKKLDIGDLVLVEDHLSLAGMAGLDPTRGENASQFGPRFTSLNRAYEPKLIEIMERSAAELGIRVHRGVYGYACGPSLETPAEVRFLNMIGVDAVGMSTVPEVVTARHCGMKVAVISAITNMAIHDLTSCEVTTEEEVWKNAPAILKKVTPLLEMFIKKIGSGE
jgi:purine-nucleoside phosphorylase